MAITCPHCGEAKPPTKLPHKELLSARHHVLGIITGTIGLVIWYYSLESKFQCSQCNRAFFARTPRAQVFRVIFYLLMGTLLIGAGIVIYLIVSR